MHVGWVVAKNFSGGGATIVNLGILKATYSNKNFILKNKIKLDKNF